MERFLILYKNSSRFLGPLLKYIGISNTTSKNAQGCWCMVRKNGFSFVQFENIFLTTNKRKSTFSRIISSCCYYLESFKMLSSQSKTCTMADFKHLCDFLSVTVLLNFLKKIRVRLKVSGRGNRDVDTFKTPSLSTNNFFLYPPPILRCFWKHSLTPPTTHHPTSSVFHSYLLAIHHSFPP